MVSKPLFTPPKNVSGISEGVCVIGDFFLLNSPLAITVHVILTQQIGLIKFEYIQLPLSHYLYLMIRTSG